MTLGISQNITLFLFTILLDSFRCSIKLSIVQIRYLLRLLGGLVVGVSMLGISLWVGDLGTPELLKIYE